MQRARSMLLVIAVLLMPALLLADDARTTLTDSSLVDLNALPAHDYWPESGYTPYWRLSSAMETTTFLDEASQPIASLEFRDPGAFARVSKVRELSLLTLAEVGKTRLFFGVNDDGLFGFHLGARPKLGDERCVELARMPYLKNTASDSSTR